MSENTSAPAEAKKEQEGGKTVLRAVTFGGFNRADVLDFIEKQKKVEAELKKKVEELETKLAAAGGADAPQTDEALQAELAAAKEKIVSLENDASALQAELSSANEKIAALEGEKASLEAQLAEAKERIVSSEDRTQTICESEKTVESSDGGAAKEEIARLTAALAAATSDNATLAADVAAKDALISQYSVQLSEKDAKVNELTEKLNAPAAAGSPEARIGAVLLDARRCADEIIASAKLEESRIRAQAYAGILKSQKAVQGISDEFDVFFERYKRNAELARASIDELKNTMDEEIKKGFEASAGGESVE